MDRVALLAQSQRCSQYHCAQVQARCRRLAPCWAPQPVFPAIDSLVPRRRAAPGAQCPARQLGTRKSVDDGRRTLGLAARCHGPLLVATRGRAPVTDLHERPSSAALRRGPGFVGALPLLLQRTSGHRRETVPVAALSPCCDALGRWMEQRYTPPLRDPSSASASRLTLVPMLVAPRWLVPGSESAGGLAPRPGFPHPRGESSRPMRQHQSRGLRSGVPSRPVAVLRLGSRHLREQTNWTAIVRCGGPMPIAEHY
mmetsp:Transcript_17753/g.45692  ORF Transcript_17753/g.45692 Transcript_17753/m.45692 type:complete len:255 (-) Transcript_17753:389-1153(-)